MTLPAQQIPPRTLRALGSVGLPIHHSQIVFRFIPPFRKRYGVINLVKPTIEFLPSFQFPLCNRAPSHPGCHLSLSSWAEGKESRRRNDSPDGRGIMRWASLKQQIDKKSYGTSYQQSEQITGEIFAAGPEAHQEHYSKKNANDDREGMVEIHGGFPPGGTWRMQ